MPSVTFPGASPNESWDPVAGYKRVDPATGDVLIQRPLNDDEIAAYDAYFNQHARNVSAEQLKQQARAAITNIDEYLAKVDAATATNADHIAMVPRLARICKALIRLEVAKDLLD